MAIAEAEASGSRWRHGGAAERGGSTLRPRRPAVGKFELEAHGSRRWLAVLGRAYSNGDAASPSGRILRRRKLPARQVAALRGCNPARRAQRQRVSKVHEGHAISWCCESARTAVDRSRPMCRPARARLRRDWLRDLPSDQPSARAPVRSRRSTASAFTRIPIFFSTTWAAWDDGIPQGLASGRDMRTTPLWGLRTLQRFLHDRSARSIEQAIERHDGQGMRSRDRFSALDADRLGTLLAFLRSLYDCGLQLLATTLPQPSSLRGAVRIPARCPCAGCCRARPW